ncbi:MAG: DUF2703 domain-containing protein [Myxococcales bacterium]|nr:DUF2703 domain-containing protein [Myxococcales bacterium]
MSKKPLHIELLYLDGSTCRRCASVRDVLGAALEALGPTFDALGLEPQLRETHITSAAQARAAGFELSPTIRLDGHDIAPARHSSSCSDCDALCGCSAVEGEPFACRSWHDAQGRPLDVPTTAVVVDALLRALYADRDASAAATQPVAEAARVARFFAARDEREERESCCAPSCCS